MRSNRGSRARVAVDRASAGQTDERASGSIPALSIGARAADAWLRARGATGTPTRTRWHVEIALDVVADRAPADFDDRTASRFHIDIYAEEWGVFFCHGGRSSWIRVTDVAFVHGRDGHHLLARMPSLDEVGALLRRLESEHVIRFHREHASIRTNLAGPEPTIRAWIARL